MVGEGASMVSPPGSENGRLGGVAASICNRLRDLPTVWASAVTTKTRPADDPEEACACTVAPVPPEMVTVGLEVYPLPPLFSVIESICPPVGGLMVAVAAAFVPFASVGVMTTVGALV